MKGGPKFYIQATPTLQMILKTEAVNIKQLAARRARFQSPLAK